MYLSYTLITFIFDILADINYFTCNKYCLDFDKQYEIAAT